MPVVFLDEFGEIPLDLQPKLLRALEDGTFRRVGGTKDQKVDVKLVAATNAPLDSEHIRPDILYRIAGTTIEVPPLCTRGRNDLALLIDHFADEVSKPKTTFSDEALDVFGKYEWPGNVRELKNRISAICRRAPGALIDLGHPDLYPYEDFVRKAGANATLLDQLADDLLRIAPGEGSLLEIAATRLQTALVKRACEMSKTNAVAAKALRIDPATLSRKRRTLGVR
jgi:two-component system response regulator AtoC